jgi:hypothetical protein
LRATIAATRAATSVAATSVLATSTAAASAVAASPAPSELASRLTASPSEMVLSPVLGALVVGPASTPAPEVSLNRFGDFENGVVFWSRGDTSAKPLAAWMSAADGTNMRLSANDVLAAVAPKIQAATGHLSGASAAGSSFLGTTSYWFDGIGAHNRRHRILASMMATRMQSGFVNIPMPVPVMCEVQVEVGFEPAERSVRAFLTDWIPVSIPSDLTANPPLIRQLHGVLDPLLWTSFDLLEIEDTNAGAPIAVLSVKTMPNGDVNIYIEP